MLPFTSPGGNLCPQIIPGLFVTLEARTGENRASDVLDLGFRENPDDSRVLLVIGGAAKCRRQELIYPRASDNKVGREDGRENIHDPEVIQGCEDLALLRDQSVQYKVEDAAPVRPVNQHHLVLKVRQFVLIADLASTNSLKTGKYILLVENGLRNVRHDYCSFREREVVRINQFETTKNYPV
jgi:hypothetical protein